MIKKILIIFTLIILAACGTIRDEKVNCPINYSFDLNISGNLSRMQEKDLLNYIVNKTNINFDKNSNYLIGLNILYSKTSSLVSGNNTTTRNNINLNIVYNLIDKKNKKTIDKKNFNLIESSNVSDYLYSNHTEESSSVDSLLKNFSIKLENRLERICKN